MDANSDCGCRKNRYHPHSIKPSTVPILRYLYQRKTRCWNGGRLWGILPNKEGRRIIIRLHLQMVMQLARINQKYAKDMVEEKGQKMIDEKTNKALYDTLNTSVLFWKDLTGTIGEWKFSNDNDGFSLNPYTPVILTA